MADIQRMSIEFGCEPDNESFARVAVAAYAARLNPTLEEISDIKTAVSEAVTNAIIHGYYGRTEGKIIIECEIKEDRLMVSVTDMGVGIEDISKAMEPMYTTRPELERSGMGFVFMEAFMDEVTVESTAGKGTTVKMSKKITSDEQINDDLSMAVGYN